MKNQLIIGLFLISLIFISCSSHNNLVVVKVKNPLNFERKNETVEINVSNIKGELSGIKANNLVVIEKESNKILVSQLIDSDRNGKFDKLIFQDNFLPYQTREFIIKNGDGNKIKSSSKAFARFVPERKDDFAWENDRIAFRMYGPALQATGEVSSGVDVWVKNVRRLVINKWYAGEDYHTDHGEGLDCYKVGPSRGCGGIAVWDGKKIFTSKNFTKWKIIANGPVRTIFELSYAPWEANGVKVSETKRVSLDAGSNLNRFQSTFTSTKKDKELMIAIGVVKHQNRGLGNFYSSKLGIFGNWEKNDGSSGFTGCGVIIQPNLIADTIETNEHNLFIVKNKPTQQLVYYAGAGWSKSGDFENKEKWFNYLKKFAERLTNPLEIKIQ